MSKQKLRLEERMSAKQELQQKVLHKYGWGNRFDKNDDGYWFAEIQIGPDNVRRFVSDDKSDDTVDGRKQGITAASIVALEGLKDDIAVWDAKPRMELCKAFPDWIPIRDSSEARCWKSFWKNKPEVVGIDTEGNRHAPPVLIQVAIQEGSLTYCILEAPKDSISPDMKRLIEDDSIKKVFCDNYSHHDKTTLGIPVEKDYDWSTGTILDIEAISAKKLGPVNVARGLGRIVSQVMPEMNIVVEKPKKASGDMKSRMQRIGRFTLIEQGKMAPLKGVNDLKKEEKRYAAVDALCTLQAYRRLIGENG